MNDYSNIEDRVVRQNNRRLRRLNGKLRRKNQEGREYADELFIELCNTSPAAEAAMRELWEKGDLDCSSEDYSLIVETALEAISFWSKHGRPKLAQDSAT